MTAATELITEYAAKNTETKVWSLINGRYTYYTKATLKNICEDLGLDSSGTRAKLAWRVVRFLKP